MKNIVKQVVFLRQIRGSWPFDYAGFKLVSMINGRVGGSANLLFRLTRVIGFLLIVTSSPCLAQLRLPFPLHEAPGPGKRVFVTPPEFAGTGVHHMLYLPPDWRAEDGRMWPVIVEYTGNHFPRSGSSGKVEDAGLGYGLGAGKCIWVTLPFVGGDGENALTWWGDAAATVRYAKTNVPRICASYGGAPNKVLLCGFSRGAIAVNYIGLYDDEIARLWAGFLTHDHYDGVREWKGTDWGTPLAQYREGAKLRLGRLKGRPVLICQARGVNDVRSYLEPLMNLDSFSFLDVSVRKIFPGFPNSLAVHPHTDRWPLLESPERLVLRAWLDETLGL